MVLKLHQTGLSARYRVFFAFFIFRIPNSIWPLYLDVKSNTYLHFWIVTTAIALVFYVLLTLELYKLVLENYKGLFTMGRWALYISLAISVAVSAITLIPKIKPHSAQISKIMMYELATERGIDTALAILIILLLGFISFFPVKLNRNVRVHAVVFSTFFLSNTLVLLTRSLFGLHLGVEINTVLLCVTAASVVAWLALLRSAGEDARRAPAAVGMDYESRLLAHLDALNAALLRGRAPEASWKTR